MSRIGPGQFFVALDPEESKRRWESLAILCDKKRVFPAPMTNPSRHRLNGPVENKMVETLGLERFTYRDLKEEWDYIKEWNCAIIKTKRAKECELRRQGLTAELSVRTVQSQVLTGRVKCNPYVKQSFTRQGGEVCEGDWLAAQLDKCHVAS